MKPPIKKGGSLLIAYQLTNRPVLLIGGGVVASGRLFFLLEAGAHVTLVAPSPLEPSIVHRLTTNKSDIIWHDREYTGRTDTLRPEHYAMVLTAIDDNDLSLTVCDMAREVHVPVNVADVPPSCDFYFGAQLRRGPLQVMVSTQGQGPKIGAMIRNRIVEALPDDIEEAIEGVGKLRADLRKVAPGVGGELGQRRMKWMIGVCDAWSLDQMGQLRDEGVRKEVLEGWEEGKVVKPEDVGKGRGALDRMRVRIAGVSLDKGTLSGLLGFVSGVTVTGLGAMVWARRR